MTSGGYWEDPWGSGRYQQHFTITWTVTNPPVGSFNYQLVVDLAQATPAPIISKWVGAVVTQNSSTTTSLNGSVLTLTTGNWSTHVVQIAVRDGP